MITTHYQIFLQITIRKILQYQPRHIYDGCNNNCYANNDSIIASDLTTFIHNTIKMDNIWMHQIHGDPHFMEEIICLLVWFIFLNFLHCHSHLRHILSIRCLIDLPKLACNPHYDNITSARVSLRNDVIYTLSNLLQMLYGSSLNEQCTLLSQRWKANILR